MAHAHNLTTEIIDDLTQSDNIICSIDTLLVTEWC